MRATLGDQDAVRALLGREPAADFEVVVRRADGAPVVIRNEPFTRDGTPMPTRYWLVDPEWNRAVSRIEAAGGVRDAQGAVDAAAITAAHAAYEVERDAAISAEQSGPRPSAGVGGTREGVKCLHAHVAWALTGAPDPVGEWTLALLDPELRAGLTVDHTGADA